MARPIQGTPTQANGYGMPVTEDALNDEMRRFLAWAVSEDIINFDALQTSPDAFHVTAGLAIRTLTDTVNELRQTIHSMRGNG